MGVWVKSYLQSFVRSRNRILVCKTDLDAKPAPSQIAPESILGLSNGSRALYAVGQHTGLHTPLFPSLIDLGSNQKTRLSVSACLTACLAFRLTAYPPACLPA